MKLSLNRPNPDTPVGMRHHYRTLFLFGGYLYEGFLLIDNLRLKYWNETFFEGFRALCVGNENTRRRKLVQKIRNSVAFHLDAEDKATPAALKNLNLDDYQLVSADDAQMGSFYFAMADTVDLNYLIDELKGEKSEPDTHEEIYRTITGLNAEFVKAADKFITGLVTKLNLHQKFAIGSPEVADDVLLVSPVQRGTGRVD
jgi:hypothetical protein